MEEISLKGKFSLELIIHGISVVSKEQVVGLEQLMS